MTDSSKKLFSRSRLVASVITAVAATAMSAQASANPIDIDIEAKSIDAALLELARESGVQIMFSPELTDNVASQPIVGKYTVPEALNMLLDKTNLSYESSDGKVFVVKRNDADTDDRDVAEEMVITGSMLRNQNPTSKVLVFDREEIERRGLNNAEEILRIVPQNFPGLNSASSRSFGDPASDINVGVVGQGTASANLRGLGADSTLVLVNNRRVSGEAQFDGNIFNLKTIPAAAIERVEILLDGASSIYGADAIGGVINFILKKDYSGAETSVRYEDSIYGGDSYTLTQLFGHNWERGNVTLTLSQGEEKPVKNSKIGFTSNDYRDRGGRDFRQAVQTQPGNVFTAVPAFPGLGLEELGSLPADNDGTSYTPPTIIFMNFPPFGDVPTVLDPGDFSVDNLQPTDLVRDDVTAVQKTTSATVSFNQELTETARFFLDAQYSEGKSNANNAVAPPVFLTVPASNAYNLAGVPLAVSYLFFNEAESGSIPKENVSSERTSENISLGFEFDLPVRDWQSTLTGNWSRSLSNTRANRFTFATTDIADNPSDDEAFIAYQQALNSSDPDTAINLFGNGSVQPVDISAFGTLQESFAQSPKNIVKSVTALFEGGVTDLPAGVVRAGIQFEYRSEELKFSENDSNKIAQLADTSPGRHILSVASQLSVPLISENNSLPGVESLTLNLGARWEDYSFKGRIDDLDGTNATEFTAVSFTNTSPKAGISWYPVETLNIRATWSEAFRAPTYTEMFGNTTVTTSSLVSPFFDPLAPGGGKNVIAEFASLPNPNLTPETSDNYTLGFDWIPSGVLEGFVASMTYNKVEYTDRIVASQRLRAFLSEQEYFGDPILFERDPLGNLIRRNTQAINQTARIAEAIDFDFSYDHNSDWGYFTYGIGGSYLLAQEDKFGQSARAIDLVETNRGPDRYRVNGQVNWSRDNYGANLFVYYSPSYDNVSQQFSFLDGIDDDAVVQRVEHWTSIDLTGFYNLAESGWNFQAGVKNVLNNKFPFIDISGAPYDSSRVDTRGRVMYVEVKKSFEL